MFNENQTEAAAVAPTDSKTFAGWPAPIQKVEYLSAADDSMQPMLFYAPESAAPAPLLVGLHTWSNGYAQPASGYAQWCIAKGWALVYPDFRGANDKPTACGSELVVKDILSAVEYARKNADVDSQRIYLVGVSGGGYAAMLMAGRAPEVWAGVSAWCGIFDLKDWYRESQIRKSHYANMIAASCGGPPGANSEVDRQYRLRSASTWLGEARAVPLDLNTGIFDGHKGSVPTSQTLDAFNVLAAPAERINGDDIAFITEKAKIPAALQVPLDDPHYQRGKVLFRKTSDNARVTVFEGGHEIIPEAALAWLEQQCQGQKPVWEIPASQVDLKDVTTEAGK